MLLIRNAEIDGEAGCDVRCRDGRITEIGRGLQGRDESVLDAHGGALLPGLHDHHIHLLALAAARISVACGPPEVTDLAALRRALQEAPGDDWIRGVGYHESVTGMLDRVSLDAICAKRPVRIQHRSGKMWFLNSAALHRVGLADSDGQLFRQDTWLRQRIASDFDVEAAAAATSSLLASFGVTGITDATAANDEASRALFARLELTQDVTLMGNEELGRGSLKILLDDYLLPDIDELTGQIAGAHASGRPVAIHCVTRTELVFALAALRDAGSGPDDRIEHASVADDAALALLRNTGVTVVTQPNLIFDRGDQYLVDVEPNDHNHLYRGNAFLAAGVPLGGGTDAPYGSADPWIAIRAAVERKTRAGKSVGPNEAMSPERALALFTSSSDSPGGPPRRVAVAQPANLCVLDRPWLEARERLSSADVSATIRGGFLTYVRD